MIEVREASPPKLFCTVCGGNDFSDSKILHAGLIRDWELDSRQVDYVNRQQGTNCTSCKCNLRSIVLAEALLDSYGFKGKTMEKLISKKSKKMWLKTMQRNSSPETILEINEAGKLTPWLKKLPGYTFGSYPTVDMTALPYSSESFDLIIHSDTLEHIEKPVEALKECRRVLRVGGQVLFTVPIIIERLTRLRMGLNLSYHGDYELAEKDQIVYSEYGADAWVQVFEAGFRKTMLYTLDFPSAIAFRAFK